MSSWMMANDTKLPAVCWEILFNKSDKTIQAHIIRVASENAGLILWLPVISGRGGNNKKKSDPLWAILLGGRKKREIIHIALTAEQKLDSFAWAVPKTIKCPIFCFKDWANLWLEQLHITWSLQKCCSICLLCCVLAGVGVEIIPRRKPEL